MMEVGIDSYITVTEADGYIDKGFVFDKSVPYWKSLTGPQKEVFLYEAMAEIETAPKQGNRYRGTIQPLEYPRRANFVCFQEVMVVPAEVKEAQAVIAFQLMKIALGVGKKEGIYLSSGYAEKIMWRWLSGGK